MEINLNQKFKDIIKSIDKSKKPNLFLHICCAPCSSAVFEKIYEYFNIYIIFYNPNIDTSAEFNKRFTELLKLIKIKNYHVKILYDDYDHDEFLSYTKGLEKESEGGIRCKQCYKLRLKKSFDIAAKYIKENDLIGSLNYLCTTLSISPHKDARLLYEIGTDICQDLSGLIKYLPSDFKKEDGYLKSIELSKKFKLYRQDYCGCEFAKLAQK